MSKELNWALWIVAQTKEGVAVAYGPPGDAKSDICMSAAKKLGRSYIQFLLSGETREDQNGVPYPSEAMIAGAKRKCLVPLFSETYLRARYENVVVHLDEMNHTPHQVFGAVQERWLNRLPESSLVFATCNPVDMATDGIELPPPVVNRCCILDWEDHDDDYEIGLETGVFPEPDIPVLPDNWADYRSKWENILLKFKRENQGHFDRDATYPKTEAESCKPWRSKRSWYRFAVNLAACESVGASIDTAHKIGNGFVGVGPTQDFFSWYDMQDFPTAAELYADPKLLKLPPRFDLANALVKSVIGHTKHEIKLGNVDNGEAYEKGIDFCEEVFRQSREVGLSCHSTFAALKPADYLPKKRQGTSLEIRESRGDRKVVS